MILFFQVLKLVMSVWCLPQHTPQVPQFASVQRQLNATKILPPMVAWVLINTEQFGSCLTGTVTQSQVPILQIAMVPI